MYDKDDTVKNDIINGLEIAKRLNFAHPDIKIIAITMYQDSLYLQQLVENGFRAYVNKMEVPELLLRTIESALQNRDKDQKATFSKLFNPHYWHCRATLCSGSLN
jgi:DNA-binding NarL/FixJ family response regulator